MTEQADHEQLEIALNRCGAGWSASQSHGLLTGRLAVAGADCGAEWLSHVLDGVEQNNALRSECEGLLRMLFDVTQQQLAERQSRFEPLLPAEDSDTAARTHGLAHWSEGFLHGLVSVQHAEQVKQRLADEPFADIIKDMLQITRAAVDDEADDEINEEAYTELQEYLRIVAQLTYEELAELRGGAGRIPNE